MKDKILILVGGREQYHDLLFAAQTLQKILIERGIATEYSQDFTVLQDERIEEYAGCVFYTQDKLLTHKQQDKLEEYIKNGHGFIPLHSANVINDEQNQKYIQLIGSKFTHHDPFHRFKVELNGEHFITENIDDFEIDDELYVTKMLKEPDQILARAHEQGEKHPILYTRNLDQGKISYLALGHDGRAWNHPSFQKLLYRTVIYTTQSL